MAFIGRKPTNAPLTSDDIPNGIIGAADLASGISGLITWQSVQTTGFTAVAGRGYPCNTTSSAFTVTLPASPSVGDTIILLDYAGTFDTNALTVNPNSNKLEGGTANLLLTGDREGVTLTYIDSTQGWLATSGIQEGSDSLSPITYLADFLVIAGGGSGGYSNGCGGGAGGYRNSYLTEVSGGGGSSETSLTLSRDTVYTITVGAGGASVTTAGRGNNGNNSSISGTGLTTITSIGGGAGGNGSGGTIQTGNSGGSGGGRGGTGTANQGFNGGGDDSGGGGAGEAGDTDGATHGGDGLASSITGSSVTRGGGGGAAGTNGGAGGGGNDGDDGVANTGGGGGRFDGTGGSGAGGSGVVILRMPTANYSGTTTGSPTVTTDGSDTILVYNASGSYTG